jgi:hypothetical protein
MPPQSFCDLIVQFISYNIPRSYSFYFLTLIS